MPIFFLGWGRAMDLEYARGILQMYIKRKIFLNGEISTPFKKSFLSEALAINQGLIVRRTCHQ